MIAALAILLLASFIAAEYNMSYVMIVQYGNGTLALKDFDLVEGNPPTLAGQPDSGYEA